MQFQEDYLSEGVLVPISDWETNPDACYDSQRWPMVFTKREKKFYMKWVRFERRDNPRGKGWRMYVVSYYPD